MTGKLNTATLVVLMAAFFVAAAVVATECDSDGYASNGVKLEFGEFDETEFTCKLIDAEGSGILNIPDEILIGGGDNKYRVVGFSRDLTFEHKNIISVRLSSHMTEIPNNMFRNCANLEEVTNAYGIEEIGSYAFSGCAKLKHYNGFESVADIQRSAFENCVSLRQNIDFDKIEKIGACAFKKSAVTGIVLHDIENIGDEAFADCANIKGTIEFNREKLVKVGVCAFRGTSVEAFYIDGGTMDYLTVDGVLCQYTYNLGIIIAEFPPMKTDFPTELFRISELHMIGEGACAECQCRFGDLVIPSGVHTIGANAFKGCLGITSVSLPERIMMGDEAFAECANLTSAHIGDIENANECAGIFRDCVKLESVDISALTRIPEQMFYGCESLSGTFTIGPKTEVIEAGAFACTNISEFEVDMFSDFFKDIDGILYRVYGQGRLMLISVPSNYPGPNFVLSENVESMGGDAFNGCKNLTGMLTIKNDVQLNDSSLRNSYFGALNLNESSFYVRNNILIDSMHGMAKGWIRNSTTNLTIPADVQRFHTGLFYQDTELKSVVLNVTDRSRFDDSVFYQCGNLEKVTVCGDAIAESNASSNLFFDQCPIKEITVKGIVSERTMSSLFSQYRFYDENGDVCTQFSDGMTFRVSSDGIATAEQLADPGNNAKTFQTVFLGIILALCIVGLFVLMLKKR